MSYLLDLATCSSWVLLVWDLPEASLPVMSQSLSILMLPMNINRRELPTIQKAIILPQSCKELFAKPKKHLPLSGNFSTFCSENPFSPGPSDTVPLTFPATYAVEL